MSVNSFLSTVQEAQQTGTLEVLMTTATPPATLVFLSAISALARNLIQFFVYIVADSSSSALLLRSTCPRACWYLFSRF